MNVNLSHNIQAGWEQLFSAYGKFWFVLTVLVAVCLYLLGLLLRKLWPAPGVTTNKAPAPGF
jgi:hypothetical protein